MRSRSVSSQALTLCEGRGENTRVATLRNDTDGGVAVRLALVGRDPGSNPAGSPTVYRTDRQSWVVQGWAVTDADVLHQMDIPEGETCVEIPDRLIQFFRQDAGGIDHG